MKKRIMIVIFTMLFCSVSSVFAQEKFSNYKFDETKTYIIELQDGSKLVGSLLQSDSLFIVIKTSLIPRIEIPVGKIKSIDIVDQANMKDGEYWFPNPNSTRYFFSPSAIMLKKGEGYYQNTYLFLNSVHVGISDNLSIGGGIEILSTFGTLTEGNFQPVFFITPKIGFQVAEKLHLGAGLLYVSVPEMFDDKRSGIGMAYGIGTYGTDDDNLTFGLGWGIVDGEFSAKPSIAISGMSRIGRKAALVTENWFVPANPYYGVLSYGVRFFGEKLSVDLAFLNSKDIVQAIFIGIPYVDFVVKF